METVAWSDWVACITNTYVTRSYAYTHIHKHIVGYYKSWNRKISLHSFGIATFSGTGFYDLFNLFSGTFGRFAKRIYGLMLN